ncbi:Myxococcales GC_trans_RRR domain-containing protein [Stigmatella aurantiaca]|uniref:Myxococcales GC_trans_RRR domain-containing protein n=1 Tax=Stigmatella aurantiaca TaxID=41 RepID=A0A1H7V2S9_STIAU|nr:chondroitinase-B domain-containing protein [Stigmatella aurantiaca]SEM03218.1 Myxococcales GC_trans_RRR domain-containing protein [Stigmatella aurantiaca]
MLKPVALLLLLSSPALARQVNISSVSQLQTALAGAQAGDELILADGTYAVNANLNCSVNGTAQAPIIVRAQNRLGALIRFNAVEGFKVSGAHWRFEGLDIQGACSDDNTCDHAFHVTGHAEHFVLRDSRVRDFNAQLKVNATQNGGKWEIPHAGLIERNELADTRPRATSHPVTKLNIDTGDNWIVRDNLIRDFHKNGGDSVSYGAFMKSGGNNGVFERNRVLCTRDVATGGTRIGLSFGGGGTGNAYCAPNFDANKPCDPEHTGGTMRNNVIANCSDVGIYLNKARSTQVLFNTLVSTSGVDFRFASSTGAAHGNVLSGTLRRRDGSTFESGTNLLNVSTATFSGWYQEPLKGDLTVRGNVSSLIGAAAARPQVVDDFCGRPRPAQGAYTMGALEHSLGDCAGWPTDGGSTSPGDGGTDGGVDGGVDAGTPSPVDAGGTNDGGPGAEGPSEEEEEAASESGCSASPGVSATLLLMALGLLAFSRPRHAPGRK